MTPSRFSIGIDLGTTNTALAFVDTAVSPDAIDEAFVAAFPIDQVVAPGSVDIALDWAPGLTQQHGFLHAGVVSAALDSACGYAAFTLMPADAEVLTIEFKINLLAPARGECFRMEGRVLKPGRTVTVCEGRAYALHGGTEKLVATMGCTLMAITGREDVRT